MNHFNHIYRWLGYAASFFLIIGCSPEADSETMFIKDVISSSSRMQQWPQDAPETRRLLDKFMPRIFVAPDSYIPISFYRDYLPQCVIRDRKSSRKIKNQSVTRAILKDIQFSATHYLDYLVTAQAARALSITDVHPEMYGRIYTDVLPNETDPLTLVFLKYSLVFPYSGLPSEIGHIKKWGSRLIGDPTGWHELDIHGAIHIVLDGKTLQPLSVLLAQHNHHRIFFAGNDFRWPEDNRVPISFSQLSNEPYLMNDGAPYRLERTVGKPMHIAYLFGATDKAPFGAGMDKVFSEKGGSKEVFPELVLLPLDDPLYTAWIPLGNIEKIWGFWETWYRRGPPGIDFYTLGVLKNLADLTAFWSIDPTDTYFFRLVEKNFDDLENYDLEPALAHQRGRLATSLTVKLGH